MIDHETRHRDAEAAAAADDFAGALRLWQALAADGFAIAPAFVARYLALTGQHREAAELADQVSVATDPAILAHAATKFYMNPLKSQWIRAAHAWVELAKPRGAVLQPLADRLFRAAFLPDLDAADQQRAVAIFDHFARDAECRLAPKPVHLWMTTSFLFARMDVRAMLRFLAKLGAIDMERAEDVRLIADRRDRLTVDDLLAMATDVADPALIDIVAAYLIGVDGEAFVGLVARLRHHRWGDHHLRAVERHFATAGDPWRAEMLFNRFAQADPDGNAAFLAGAELAATVGDAPLAIARDLVATRAAIPLSVALASAERLLALGYRHEPAKLLEPHVDASEKAALLRASALWRAAPALRESSYWRAAVERHDTSRLRRGLAAALADELDYDSAIALLDAVVPGDAGPLAYRDLALTLERIGAHDTWDDLVSMLEERFPNDPWVIGERLKYLLETGQMARAAALDQPAPPPADIDDIHLGRAVARQSVVEGRSAEACELWARVAARSNLPNDHYQHILAQCQNGAFAEATDHLAYLTRRLPGDYRLHLKLAQLHERDSRFDAALDSFFAALRVEPENLDSLAGIARCLTYLGRTRDCDAWLDAFEPVSIWHSWALCARAFNAVRAQRPDDARQALERLRGLATDFRAAREREAIEDPGAVWCNGRALRDPRPETAENARRFAEHLRWLEAGDVILIGNSPKLLGTGRGAEIDSHDRVIRLNDFRLDGFEADIGRRTDLWFSSANRLARPNLGKAIDAHIWISQPHPQHLPQFASFIRGRLGLELSQDRTCFLPAWMHQLSAQMIYPRPTSGFRLIGLLEFFVGRPYAITGFSFFQDAQMHYFEQQEGHLQVGEVHAVGYERDFVTEVLPLAGRIRPLAV